MIVSFSGIDGSGKSTRCQALVRLLQDRGVPASSGKPEYEANEAVKDFCEWRYGDRYAYFSQLDGEFYISCLVADWLGYLTRVLSRVPAAEVLVCDRYVYDVLAQAVHMKAQAAVLRRLWHLFPRPDIDYLLELSPEEANERLKRRCELPMHMAESLGELRVLHAAYRQVAEQLDWNPVVVKDTIRTEDLAREVEQTWQRIRMGQAI